MSFLRLEDFKDHLDMRFSCHIIIFWFNTFACVVIKITLACLYKQVSKGNSWSYIWLTCGLFTLSITSVRHILLGSFSKKFLAIERVLYIFLYFFFFYYLFGFLSLIPTNSNSICMTYLTIIKEP